MQDEMNSIVLAINHNPTVIDISVDGAAFAKIKPLDDEKYQARLEGTSGTPEHEGSLCSALAFGFQLACRAAGLKCDITERIPS